MITGENFTGLEDWTGLKDEDIGFETEGAGRRGGGAGAGGWNCVGWDWKDGLCTASGLCLKLFTETIIRELNLFF